jgi:predicted membrane chloride channel (bestrophin family)
MILAFFLLGIEELAVQLEEPFSVLPLDKIAGGIGLSADEHSQWAEEALTNKKIAQRNAILYQGETNPEFSFY